MLILLSMFACIEEDRDNRAPELTYISGSKVSIWENCYYNIDKTIAKWIIVKDSLGSTLKSAEIKIVDGFVPLEDKLKFLSQNGITGTFDTATATLKLNGESSIANYEIALQSVSYENKNGFSNNDRNISFQVDDGRKRSNIIYRKVKFISYSQNQIQLALGSWELDYYQSGYYTRDFSNGVTSYQMDEEVSHENTPAESELWKKKYDFRIIENDGDFILEISTERTLCSKVYGGLEEVGAGKFSLRVGEPELLNACKPIIQLGAISGFIFSVTILEPNRMKLEGTMAAGGPTHQRIVILKR